MSTDIPTPEDELIKKEIDGAFAEISKSASSNELTHIGWLVQGLDVWHRSNGTRGHSSADAARYVISNVVRLIHQQRRQAVEEVLDRLEAQAYSQRVRSDESSLGSHLTVIHVNAIQAEREKL